MLLTFETEFNIIRNEDETRGFYVAVENSDKLDKLIKDKFKKEPEEFWEIYSEEEGAMLFAMLTAYNIPYTETGWQETGF